MLNLFLTYFFLQGEAIKIKSDIEKIREMTVSDFKKSESSKGRPEALNTVALLKVKIFILQVIYMIIRLINTFLGVFTTLSIFFINNLPSHFLSFLTYIGCFILPQCGSSTSYACSWKALSSRLYYLSKNWNYKLSTKIWFQGCSFLIGKHFRI